MSWPDSERPVSRSASQSQALVNPQPSSAPSKAGHSTLSKHRGTYSNPPLVPLLAAAHEAGIGVIVKEPLANGRLTARGDIPELAAAAERVGTTPDALALAAAISQPWGDVVLSGAATPTALRSNLAALTLEPPREILNELDGLREEPTHYWRARGELPWN